MVKCKNVRTVKQNVEALLRDYPDTRNNDKLLIIVYWKIYDRLIMKDENSFVRAFLETATMPESIRRARQQIQADGLYLPSEEVTIKRRGMEERVRESVRKVQ